MNFFYEPLSDDEIQKDRVKLLDKGEYNFVVNYSISEVSKAGNPMIRVLLEIFDDTGHKYLITDYLVNNGWKLKSFCKSVGLSNEYMSRQFTEFLARGKRGRAVIDIDIGKEKEDGSGKWDDKNKVSRYIDAKVDQVPSQPVISAQQQKSLDQDVPF